MRQVLGIAVRSDNGSTPEDRKRILDTTIDRARTFLDWSCPAPPDGVSETCWSDGRHLALLGWQNEVADPIGSMVWQRPEGQAWLLGYAGRQDPGSSLIESKDLLDSTSMWSGCFSVVRAGANTVEVVTDATRSCPVYVVETPTVRLIGTRAVQLHLIAQAEIQKSDDPLPVWDIAGMRHLAAGGYFLGDRTPFADVSAAPIRSVTVIAPDRSSVRLATSEQAPAEPRGTRLWSETVDSVANALVGAFDPIPVSRLRVGVTGGRDSRMIAAALSHRADLDVSLFTGGHSDTPDVIIGRQVAHILGFAHEALSSEPAESDEAFQTEDLLVRIVRNLDVHDGMTSAWDDSRPYGPYEEEGAISGVGGEILRGGRNIPGDADATPARAVSILLRSLVPGRIFTPDVDRDARTFAEPLVELARTEPYRALDDFYFNHRNSRWVSARRTAVRHVRGAYDPMLDHRVVQLVRSVPAETRWLEHLAFDVIERLAPGLRDLPIESSRWRFERNGPSPRSTAEVASQWDARYAMVGRDIVARTTARALPTATLRAQMNSFILGRLDDSVSGLLDRRATAEWVSHERTRPSELWHLATALVAMQVPWYKTTRPPRRLTVRTGAPTR
jgi:hypothetical protein